MWLEYLLLMKQEMTIILVLFFLLFLKLGKDRSNESYLKIVNVLLLLNLVAGFFGSREGVLFNEMFRTNSLMVLEKNILNLGMLIVSLQAYSWLKDHKHVPEFYMLLLSTLLGMFFMISGGNLLMFYLGLELSTIPLAAAANFDLTRRRSSEAAMKLLFSSAFASALLLFGISMIYGTTGTLIFSELPIKITGDNLQIFAFILVLSGFAFKISAVPFHLWTADVYEGAPVSVTSFLSVVSKGAVIFVFVSVLYSVFRPISGVWYLIIATLSFLTIFTGNLFAIRQNNFKRFLAYSSIAQVGFILVGISGSNQDGAAAVVYFVLIYLFSNLAAFGVIAVVSAATGKENISDYKGFYKTNPVLAWMLAIALFSLAGVPPTAGFFGKYFLLFSAAAKANYVLLSFAALNLVISFYYYLRVVKAIFMDSNDQPIAAIRIPLLPKLALYACVAGALAVGFFGWLYEYIHSLSRGLH
ncbi:MAG: NADH-quinone oxidoreductase subunit N [Chitinophagaceae bacterium]|nr:MAG: NADH-quinone oxidoreductase subunit N [Chitinophagaceae bacterium]